MNSFSLRALSAATLILILSINSLADDTAVKAQNAAPVAGDCQIVLTGEPSFATQNMLEHTTLTSFDDLVMFSGLGAVTGVRDFDRLSNGRIALATSKGYVLTFTMAEDSRGAKESRLSVDKPFLSANILGLRPQLDSSLNKRVLAISDSTIKVVQARGLYAELPNSGLALNADFTSGRHVTAVFPSQIRVYDYRQRAIVAEWPAINQISAGAVSPVTGHVLALDGEDLYLYKSDGERTKLTTIKGYVNAIVWGTHGSRFYVRQGATLRFFESDGTPLAQVELNGAIQSMQWDLVDRMVAISAPGETFILHLDTGKRVNIGRPGEQWRRVLWSDRDGLLLTLGPEKRGDREHWRVNVWNPSTGEKTPLAYDLPLRDELEGYPYLAGLRGSVALGDLRFLIVRQNGEYSEVMQMARRPMPLSAPANRVLN